MQSNLHHVLILICICSMNNGHRRWVRRRYSSRIAGESGSVFYESGSNVKFRNRKRYEKLHTYIMSTDIVMYIILHHTEMSRCILTSFFPSRVYKSHIQTTSLRSQPLHNKSKLIVNYNNHKYLKRYSKKNLGCIYSAI